MQQGDQTVFSLRPGGGRGSRLFNPRLEQSSVSSSSISSAAAAASSIAFGDLPSLRPGSSFKAGDMRFEGQERVRYTRDQLLQLREASVISDGILKVKQEIDAELFGEEPSWSRGESNPPNQPQTRYSEPDNRDLRGRAAQFSMFITGIHYKDDPTIMAWELMNEPRCTSDPTSRTIQRW